MVAVTHCNDESIMPLFGALVEITLDEDQCTAAGAVEDVILIENATAFVMYGGNVTADFLVDYRASMYWSLKQTGDQNHYGMVHSMTSRVIVGYLPMPIITQE